MAKISVYPDGGGLLPADKLIVARSGANKSILGSSLSVLNGWIPVSDTWTYASANTINVPTGATSVYSKFMKVRFKQGGAFKYFYIYSVAATLLTVGGGASFSVANAPITDISYSVAEIPMGFPTFILSAPTWTTTGVAFTNTPTDFSGKFQIHGDVLTYAFFAKTGNPSNGTGVFIATFAAGMLPLSFQIDGGGVAGLSSNPPSGFSGVWTSLANTIRLSKYDGTAITVANLTFFYAFGSIFVA